ncbi:MAG: acyltransferase, partial [Gammaproteobacteria bacterium]
MLHRLPAPIHGVIMSLLLILNTVFWAIPVYLMILVKLVTPKGRLRDAVSQVVARLAQTWATVNSLLAQVFLRIEWD